MEHICPKCGVIMTEARLDYAGLIIYKNIEKKPRKVGVKFSEMSDVNQSVCPKCGYIEFYAEEPEKFK